MDYVGGRLTPTRWLKAPWHQHRSKPSLAGHGHFSLRPRTCAWTCCTDTAPILPCPLSGGPLPYSGVRRGGGGGVARGTSMPGGIQVLPSSAIIYSFLLRVIDDSLHHLVPHQSGRGWSRIGERPSMMRQAAASRWAGLAVYQGQTVHPHVVKRPKRERDHVPSPRSRKPRWTGAGRRANRLALVVVKLAVLGIEQQTGRGHAAAPGLAASKSPRCFVLLYEHPEVASPVVPPSFRG